MSEVGSKLGQQIRAIRNAKGISLERLAEMASMSPTFLSDIERGRKVPSLQSLLKMSHALEVKLSDLTTALEAETGKLTKFEVLGRIERGMKEFFSEAECEELLRRTRPEGPS